VTRSGEVITPEVAGDFDRFYAIYIDSWRISSDESLFHYDDGESTEGFQLPDFPLYGLTFDDLDPFARNDAEAVCREGGVIREDLLAACIYDVVITGDVGFAYDAYVFQEALPTPVRRAPAGPLPPGGDFLIFGDYVVEFDGFAPLGWCSADAISLGAAAVAEDTSGRPVEVSIQYFGGDDPIVAVVVRRDGRAYAWLVNTVDPPTGTVEDASWDGATLTVTGTAFVDESPDVTVLPNPMLPLPGSTPFVPFSMSVTCDQ
jgi:hypothetical protein